jgi:F-type H+-transporting ATPase subunit delta
LRPSHRGAARRYARALLEVALPAREDAAVAEGLKEAVALLGANPDLLNVLTHPGVSAERKRALVEAVWKRSESPLVKRLLLLLADRERIELLTEVARAYVEHWNAHRGVVIAEVASAVALAPEQTRRLTEALGRAAGGRRVELQTRLDPALLGGVLVKMEGRVYDASVRGRLRALRRHLLGREVA